MSSFEIKYSGDFKKFEKFLDSKRHMKILETEVGQATAMNAALIQDEIIRRILTRNFKTKNSPLTIALKKSSTPLIDTSDMMKAIDVELKGSFTAFVGFLKNQKTSHGGNMNQVVPRLEKGFEVKITPQMKMWLYAKMRRAGIAPNPVKTSSSGVLRIPPRPFITPVFESKAMARKLNRNWKEAVKRAYKQMGAL